MCYIIITAINLGESVNLDGTITAKQAYELLENQTNAGSGFKIRVDYPEGTLVF